MTIKSYNLLPRRPGPSSRQFCVHKYKYSDMKIEVFKDYAEALRLLDGSWSLGSENHRDGKTSPPYRRGLGNPEYNESYVNELAPESEDRPGTIYLFSDTSSKVFSTQQNIVLDTTIPHIRSLGGTYTAFLKNNADASRTEWHLEFQIKDDSGIDGEVYDLFDGIDDENVFLSYSRKSGTSPYWKSERVKGDNWKNVHVRVEKSKLDDALYNITIDIDPSGFFTFDDDGNIIDSKDGAPVHSGSDNLWYMKLGVRFFDIAGNICEDTLDNAFILFAVSKENLLRDVQRLKLGFNDTYPSNMFVGDNMLGHTKVVVYDPNDSLRQYGFNVKIGLKDGSVGYMSGETEVDGVGSFIQLVDGIDRSGFVIAYAYLEGEFSVGEGLVVTIDDEFASELKALTYVEGELGRFIVECENNNRKLYIDPFIPSVLKSEKFYGLCKLLEDYLNTMYTPLSGDCRIGLLEKIDRISHFKDPDTCEPELISRFAEEYGSELKFNHDEVKKAAETLLKYSGGSDGIDTEYLVEQIYRRYFSILPYIDRWKGTDRAIELIFRILGIDADIIPLWEGPNGDLVPEEQAGDDYRLSSHIRIKLTSDNIPRRDMVSLYNFVTKAVKSILPVTRVISDVRVEDEFSGGAVTITVIKSSMRYSQNVEKILFSWNCYALKSASISGSTSRIILPAYPEYVHVGHDAETSEAYPIPRYAGFYFTRLKDYLKTYKTNTFKMTFADSTEDGLNTSIDMNLKIQNISIKQNKIVLDVDGNGSDITKYNTNIQDPSKQLCIGFKFARDLPNYCEPITLRTYQDTQNANPTIEEDSDEN